MLSIWKLRRSSSISGASYVTNPNCPKTSAMASIVSLIGWSVPRRIGRPGVVTSVASARRRVRQRRSTERRATLREGGLDGRPHAVGDGPDASAGRRRAGHRSRAGRSSGGPSCPGRRARGLEGRDVAGGRDAASASSRSASSSRVRSARSTSVLPWVGRESRALERQRRRGPAGSFAVGCRREGSGALGELDDPPEGGRVANRQVGQDLAVDLHVGLLEAVDELAVGEAVLRGPPR